MKWLLLPLKLLQKIVLGNERYCLQASGIFGNHLDYAKWYATQWAMPRIKDVVDNHDLDSSFTTMEIVRNHSAAEQ